LTAVYRQVSKATLKQSQRLGETPGGLVLAVSASVGYDSSFPATATMPSRSHLFGELIRRYGKASDVRDDIAELLPIKLAPHAGIIGD
jgi:hypothetical protein